MTGFSAVVVGSTLEAPPSADDKRVFFVIGAGLSAIVLFLIAEVWQFYHHYRTLLAEATNDRKRLALIDLLIQEGPGTNWRKKSRVKMLSIVRPSGFCG